MYRLHGFCQSGNTFKVAFLLRALGQPWEPVFLDFMHGATREPQWRETANAMGEVRVLGDGARRLTQSDLRPGAARPCNTFCQRSTHSLKETTACSITSVLA